MRLMGGEFMWRSGRERGASKRQRTMWLCMVAAFLHCSVSACGSRGAGDGGQSSGGGVIIVNAPAAGEVRRVLVREGVTVDEGAPIAEIAVRDESINTAPTPRADDPIARAGQNIGAAEAGIKAARNEVVRYEVEVQRLTPLVAAGQASSGELDGARALYEQAQQRLRLAQAAVQNAQAGLIAARQPSRGSATTGNAPRPTERIIIARASSAGIVRVVSVQVGARVLAGQPLATLRND